VPHVLRTSMYFDREVHDALREIAFRERLNVSDLVNEGLDAVFKARGYPSVSKLKDRGAKRRKGDRVR
ncbi:ribbon-helix-helix domain-containing protein, partial [Lichenibacterium dinghuense]|uniref:ribbon-helix-helix domain-containing protein n=1 Tax=Lichenibacterium dinghuense TaxID=2895977 RepID=UPI001F32DC73